LCRLGKSKEDPLQQNTNPVFEASVVFEEVSRKEAASLPSSFTRFNSEYSVCIKQGGKAYLYPLCKQ
jgi:hypothetical protein